MADKMLRIAGRGQDGTAKSIQTDNFGKLKNAGDSYVKVHSGNYTLQPGAEQVVALGKLDVKEIFGIVHQYPGQSVTVKVRQKSISSYGVANSFTSTLFDKVSFRDNRSRSWVEIVTDDVELVITNTGTIALGATVVIMGNTESTFRLETKADMINATLVSSFSELRDKVVGTPTVLSEVVGASWGIQPYSNFGLNTISDATPTAINVSKATDIKLVIKSNLNEPIFINGLRSRHPSTNNMLQAIRIPDYYPMDVLTINPGQTISFGTAEANSLGDINVFDSLLSNIHFTLSSLNETVPVGTIDITLIGRV